MEENGPSLLLKPEHVSYLDDLDNDQRTDTNSDSPNYFETSKRKVETEKNTFIEVKEIAPRSLRSQSKVFKSFKERLEELKSYKSMYGDCRVPSKYETNPSMAAWCANLKQSYRLIQQGKKPILKLSQEKIDALQDAGFEWGYSARGRKSNASRFLLDLKTEEISTPPQERKNDFKDRTASSPLLIENTAGSLSAIEENDLKSEDVAAAKRGVRKNEQTEMQQVHPSAKRARKRTKTKSFDERIEELKEFKARFGHCRVSRNDSSYCSLGWWCHNMRGSYRETQKQINKDSLILSKNKIEILNTIGFDWTLKEPRQVKSFNERLDDLKKFKEIHGHTRVPTGYEKNPSLAYWCNNLRNAYKMRKTGKKQFISLSQERIAALKEVGFEFMKKSHKNGERSTATDYGMIGDSDYYSDSRKAVSIEGGVGPILFV